MKVKTEAVIIEGGGSITAEAAASLDFTLGTGGFYIPQFATGDLPAFADVEGMLAYDTTTNKLCISDGSAWKVCTFD